MQTLAHELEDGRFTYLQVARQGDIALYQQVHKASGHIRYEVIKIKIQPEHTWPTGGVTPEKEGYPAAGGWGQVGGTFFNLKTAQQKMAELVGTAAAPAAASREGAS